MTNELQQEQASLYAAGAMSAEERKAFEAELQGNAELRELVQSLQSASTMIALAVPQVALPDSLKEKVLARIDEKIAAEAGNKSSAAPKIPGFSFVGADDRKGWKELPPLPGAWIKFLSIERERGYAVLMGRLEPGVHYPAHKHEGAEEIFILTGDLFIGDRKLEAGDFHHADAGTSHPVNHTEDGCTLIAVLPMNHELVLFAMA